MSKRQLKRVGFFRELEHGYRDGPSLRDCVAAAPQPHEDDIVRYLRGGIGLLAFGGMMNCVIEPACFVVGTGSVLTDGAWIWPDDLAHYVGQHHARLPEPFLAHLAARGHRPPQSNEIDLRDLEI